MAENAPSMSLRSALDRARSPAVLATVLVCTGLLAAPILPAVASPGGSAVAASPDGGAESGDAAGESGLTVTAMTAPHDASLGNESAIAAARDAGRLTPTDTLAPGDRFVLRLTADGLVTDLRNADGGNDTERLRSLFDGDGASLSVAQTEATTSASRQQKTLGLLEPDALTVVPVGTDEVYLVSDTDTLGVVYGGPYDGRLYGNATVGDLRAGEAYNVTVRTGDGAAATTVEVTERAIDGPVAGGAVYAVPGERSEVALETTLAPGTDVVVDLALGGREDRAVTGVVGPNGSLRVPVDATDLPAGTDGTATGRDPYDGRYAAADTATVPVRVRAERGAVDSTEATLRTNGVRLEATLNVSHPGFVVAFEDDSDDPIHVFGPFGAGSDIPANEFVEAGLEPGDEVRFVAVRDVDQDGTYDETDERFAAGDPVSTVTVADGRPETTTTASTTTDAPTTTPVESTTTRPTTDGSETTAGTTAADGNGTSAENGGDGAVPAAGVVGTLAAVLLALAIRRRRPE